MLALLSMDDGERHALLRDEHRRRRRQVRRRRAVAVAVVLALAAGITLGVRRVGGGSGGPEAATKAPSRHRHAVVPREIRGVHVTMSLASLPRKLESYLDYQGLNTIELDFKDESGRVGFVPRAVPLAVSSGAAGPFYDAKRVARTVHEHGDYLIGRIVTFEDPVLAEKRPELSIRRRDGSPWVTNGGLGWTNPYDRRVWRYNVDLAAAAARAGFDEIQFDYVRFPSDGDLSVIRYPGTHPQPMAWTIPSFVHYAAKRLHRLGARVSVDVFGLAATHDLGIGQRPRRISQYADALYPMVYPSHYSSGEFDEPDPDAAPAATVSRSLQDFQVALEGRKARLTPWLQDFSLGRTYTLRDVRAQVAAARALHTKGFLLWNAEGVYSTPALLPPA